MTIQFHFIHGRCMRHPKGSRPALERFLDERARERGYTLAILRLQDRRKAISEVRQRCVADAYDTGKWSFITIGHVINRDHSTVVHAVQKYRALAQQEVAA